MSEQSKSEQSECREAMVSILIREDGKGDVDVKLESEPAVPMKDGEPDWHRCTAAQAVALAMLSRGMEMGDTRK
jgi:hypothetical protein